MLHSLVFALCLLCFLWQSRSVQCRSTGRESEYNSQENPEGRCLQYCLQKTSSHQTCFQKCLEKAKEDKMVFHDKSSSISANLKVLNPLSIIRRKRSSSGDDPSKLCPKDGTGNNTAAVVKAAERKQYENSKTWYLNISWFPINEESTNFTGYAFIYFYATMTTWKYIVRQKNETYVVFNESVSGWSYESQGFFFAVIARPCLTGTFPFKDLDDFLPRPSPTVPSTTNATISTTASTVSPTKETAITTAIIASIAATGTLILIIGIGYRLRPCQKKHLPSSQIIVRSRSPGFTYDAFIIFNQKDQVWVESKLLRLLEEKHGFKCCVHYRDFEVGKSFVSNMSKSVEVSRKVIAVASREFFESNFCNYELEQAIYKQAQEKENFIIVIRKDDVSNDKLPAALKERSFIDYSNKVERKTWVSKLIKALESSRNEETLSINVEDNRPCPV